LSVKSINIFQILGYPLLVLQSPHLLEDMMAMKYTLPAENGVFKSYVNACHLKEVITVCIM